MKIKKILNDIGAVSKQAIIGGAIGVATLAVGIGLMNNFTGSGSEQGFASNALESGYSSYDSSYSGAGTSAQDIMSARNYSYGEKKAVITGTENLAFNRGTSASGQGSSGAQDYADASQAGTYSDGTNAYGAGKLEGMGTSNKITVDVSHDEEAKAKAQRDAKIAKGEALGKQARGTLKTSKMADASGIKDMPTGSTSMTYGTMGSSGAKAAGAADSSRVSLNQAGLANVNLQTAKAGKLGAMGTGGVEADGKKLGRASVGQNYQTLGDLGRAVKYSRSAKKVIGSDTALGASDAAAAFDGSKAADAVNLDGENLQAAAVSNLKDMGAPDMNLDLDKLKEDLEIIDENMQKYDRLMDQYKMCIYSMLLIASAAAVGIAIASKFGWPGAIAGLVISFIAFAGILACQIASNAFLGKIASLASETGYTPSPTGWDWAAPWLLGAGLAGVIVASWFVPFSKSFVFGLLGSLGGSGLTSSLAKMINIGKNLKANKEAEEAARKIKGKTDSL